MIKVITKEDNSKDIIMNEKKEEKKGKEIKKMCKLSLFDDIDDVVNDLKYMKISITSIIDHHRIGKGNFGIVFKSLYKKEEEENTLEMIPVALKVFHPFNRTDMKEIQNILSIIMKIKQMDHVLSYIGVFYWSLFMIYFRYIDCLLMCCNRYCGE